MLVASFKFTATDNLPALDVRTTSLHIYTSTGVELFTSQKIFIGNDTLSEIVNDPDSDGGNFSELSDSDTNEGYYIMLNSEEIIDIAEYLTL
jgi:hypothetical protein